MLTRLAMLGIKLGVKISAKLALKLAMKVTVWASVLFGVWASTLTGSMGVAQASQLPDYPFIHASGMASRWMAPDIGEIDFEIAVTDADAEAAVKLAQSRNAGVLALLADQGVPLADIEVSDIQKKMRWRDGVDGKASAAYDITQSVHIVVHDLAKWQGLIAPLLAMENLGNFGISFDRTDRDQIGDELTTSASKDAQRHGATLAAAFGKRLGPPVAISAGRLRDVGVVLGLAASENVPSRSDDKRRPEILDFSAPARVPFVQSVDVIFRIK
jgi:uncharacterized protein YggE